MTITAGDIESLQKRISEIDTELSEYMESGPESTEAAEILVALNLAKRDFSIVYDSFAGKVGSLIKNGTAIDLPSGAIVEKKSATDRKKWEHGKLASRVAERLSEMAIDMDTGEVAMSPKQMVEKLLDYAAVSYWRVGKLGELGINPDHYCEQGEYKTSIIVRLGDKK
jgi:hypothetical protein